jgi:hypothetical protein
LGKSNPAMLWYMQPGRPSEYANIDVNTEGKDYLLNIALIFHRIEKGLKYLIADKNLFLYVRSATKDTWYSL